MNLSEKFHALQNGWRNEINSINSADELENLRIKYLGRKGLLNNQFHNLSDLGKKNAGIEYNLTKRFIEQSLKDKLFQLTNANSASSTDVTVKYEIEKYSKGSLHMTTLAIEEISRIFEKIGFVRVSYPEVEWEYFSFEALNMPKGHPARDDFETFYIDQPEDISKGKMILTPHTSSGQIREMLRLKKPQVRMINIAKTYRLNWDTTHTPMFHQFEGLCVDKDINITHLKGTIDYFAKEFFGEKREIRLRPFHFQFTEPSFEVDVSCGVCLGKGSINGKKCKVCKSGWLELGGAGMVHPNVFRYGGIDPDIYSGWAFGFGPERCFMMKEGLKIDDLRTVYENDVRFLEQF